ncbi:hypothetical protein [Acidihalobacter ferrooxydans]|uniref:Uncharacterized protein n=1 Tax=Acidihalobacter ferrooxydans TaxID=1765967 RepID=A0A1P8UFZ4_9GAMM|nr:hypothetical protein [Acidihalobacter ferrooxydans]APZ42762.1 hypothetical protein BW247_06360 [Acidihalobacter ferrooxydans]
MSDARDAFDLAPLRRVCARIEAAPTSGIGLMLYGLLKGMQVEQRGSPFALTRLRMLEADVRADVYALMELFAQQANHAPEWMAMLARMDELVGAEARAD